jgi:hypothetical protein
MQKILGTVVALTLVVSACGEIAAKKTDGTPSIDPGWVAPDNQVGGSTGQPEVPGEVTVNNGDPGEGVGKPPSEPSEPIEVSPPEDTTLPDVTDPPSVDRDLMEEQCHKFGREVCKQISRCGERDGGGDFVDECVEGFVEEGCSEEGFWSCPDGKIYDFEAVERCIDSIRDTPCREFPPSDDPCEERCR